MENRQIHNEIFEFRKSAHDVNDSPNEVLRDSRSTINFIRAGAENNKLKKKIKIKKKKALATTTVSITKVTNKFAVGPASGTRQPLGGWGRFSFLVLSAGIARRLQLLSDPSSRRALLSCK